MRIFKIDGYPITRPEQTVKVYLDDGTELCYRCFYGGRAYLYPTQVELAGTLEDPRIILFAKFGIISRHKFVEEVVGYKPLNAGSGYSFPEVNTIEDLNKVLKALLNYGKDNIINKKHKAHPKLNFKL